MPPKRNEDVNRRRYGDGIAFLRLMRHADGVVFQATKANGGATIEVALTHGQVVDLAGWILELNEADAIRLATVTRNRKQPTLSTWIRGDHG